MNNKTDISALKELITSGNSKDAISSLELFTSQLDKASKELELAQATISGNVKAGCELLSEERGIVSHHQYGGLGIKMSIEDSIGLDMTNPKPVFYEAMGVEFPGNDKSPIYCHNESVGKQEFSKYSSEIKSSFNNRDIIDMLNAYCKKHNYKYGVIGLETYPKYPLKMLFEFFVKFKADLRKGVYAD